MYKRLKEVSKLQRINPKYISMREYTQKISENNYPKRIFSGIQPTGNLHLGNYLGAVQKWIQLQDNGENVIWSIVDMHSITLPHDPKELSNNILKMTATLLACGIDPKKSILFQQSTVDTHAQLCWILGCLTSFTRLARLPQFKEKKDASQRIKSLRDPSKKMSKSDQTSKSRLDILDKPEILIEKLKKAVTDFTSKVTYEPEKRPGVSNLVTIHSMLTGKSPDQICSEVEGLDTGKYKLVLADVIVEKLNPIREEFSRLIREPAYLQEVLRNGTERATEIASDSWCEVRNKIGFENDIFHVNKSIRNII
ncbi:tryptophan--tRNA ligase, mitochondrial isoform X2 [Frieseomelitta varia]|uniref:tryptophan--tRNA ligase, mitochondrial isoform X2 n=1 Tax=Frieseomelitta varia TaxID=561572 RepID=UPI001CB6A1A1|nr:tryptophan--tRNA ligase, mitochondrial isoform X2 [Frieseomelitta varia]